MGKACSLLTALLLAACATAFARPGLRRMLGDGEVEQAIVGGSDAPRARFRFMASLRSSFDGQFPFCGGVLVHPSAVLTAGHCVRNHFTGEDYSDDMHRPLVRLGGYYKTTDPPSAYEVRLTKTTVVHPKFKTRLTKNLTQDFMTFDAALLILDKPSTMPFIKLPAPQPKPGNPLPDWSSVTALGWGWVKVDEVDADALQMLSMKLAPLGTCQADLGDVAFLLDSGTRRYVHYNFSTNSLICAARDYPNTYSGICAGDSGSPLVVKGDPAAAGGDDKLAGIASFASSKCGQTARKPSAFTDVAAIMGWVNQVLAPLGTPGGISKPSDGSQQLVGKVDATKAVGFGGKSTKVTQAAGSTLRVLTWPKWSLTASLVAAKKGGVVLGSVSARGPAASVRVALVRGVLALKVNGALVAAGRRVTVTGGSVRFGAVEAGKSRMVTLSQPGLAIRVIQPWSRQLSRLLPQLSVEVVLTKTPTSPLGGLLGGTLPQAKTKASSAGQVAAVAAPLTASLLSGGA